MFTILFINCCAIFNDMVRTLCQNSAILNQFSSIISDPVSGAVDDYWYSEGIKYSYTFELPPMTVQQGHFILPTSEIYPVAIEIIAGLKAFSELELDI